MSDISPKLLLILHDDAPVGNPVKVLERKLKVLSEKVISLGVMLPLDNGKWGAQLFEHVEANKRLDMSLSLVDIVRDLHDSFSSQNAVVLFLLFKEFDVSTLSDTAWHDLSFHLLALMQRMTLYFAYDPRQPGVQELVEEIYRRLENENYPQGRLVFQAVEKTLPSFESLAQGLLDLFAHSSSSQQPAVQQQAVVQQPPEPAVEAHDSPAADPPPALPKATAQWESNEPDDPYFAVPHELLTYIDGINDWKIVGASIRGRGHAHDGKYREDSFAIDKIACWNIIAVSDGAGSRKYSRIGAKFATGAALRGIKSYAQNHAVGCDSSDMATHLREALYAGISYAYDRLESFVLEEQEIEVDFHDLGCTLLLAIYCETNSGYLVAGLQVGDGLIMVARDPEQLEDIFELTEGDTAEFSGGTTFLTSKKLETWLQREVSIVELDKAPWLLIAMTDGVADDMVPYERNVPRFLLPSLQRTGILLMGDQLDEAAQNLAKIINYEKKASFDDRTLVMMFQNLENRETHLTTEAMHHIPDSSADTAESQSSHKDNPPPPDNLPEF